VCEREREREREKDREKDREKEREKGKFQHFSDLFCNILGVLD
jgi:hypothetical protein